MTIEQERRSTGLADPSASRSTPHADQPSDGGGESAASDESTSARSIKEAIKHRAREGAEDLRHSLGSKVSEAREWVSDHGRRAAERQKDRLAEEIDHLGHAAASAGQTLKEESDPTLGRYAQTAAQEIASAAEYLRQRDCRQLHEDARQVVRRHPELFLGGLFVMGVAIGRFLRASSPADAPAGRERSQRDKSYASGSAMHQPLWDDKPPRDHPAAASDPPQHTTG